MMTNNIKLLAAGMLVFMTSCDGNMIEQQNESNDNEITFIARMDGNIQEGSFTRTYLSGYSTLWNNGDFIKVNGSTVQLVAPDGSGLGMGSGSISPDTNGGFLAGYPADNTTFTETSGSQTMSIEIPAYQAYDATHTLWEQMPMAAYSKPGTDGYVVLEFKNAANILKLNLWSSTATDVSGIVISSSAAPLSGTVPVTVSGGDVIFGNMTSTSKSISLNCETPVTVSTNENSPTPFYFIIPKLEANTVLTVRVYDSSHNCQENNITVSDSKNNGLMNAVNKLYATNSQAYSPVAGPYVAFEETTYNAMLKNYVRNEYITNECIEFTGNTVDGYEKLYIPIKNLTPNNWYTITFDESVSSNWSVTYWASKGSYSSAVVDTKIDNNGGLTNYINTTDQKYIWVHAGSAMYPDKTNSPAYLPVASAKTTFYATNSTMYWIFDYSRLADSKAFTVDIRLSGERIKKLVAPTSAYVDLPNTTLHGFKNSNSNCNSLSYKMYADYSSLIFQTVGTKSHEKINIPLCNLEKDKKYKITFDYDRTLLDGTAHFINEADLDFCCGISSTKNETIGSSGFHSTGNYSDNFTDANSYTGKTFEFTAPADGTCYWVWAVSKLTDDMRFVNKFSNVSIAEVPVP